MRQAIPVQAKADGLRRADDGMQEGFIAATRRWRLTECSPRSSGTSDCSYRNRLPGVTRCPPHACVRSPSGLQTDDTRSRGCLAARLCIAIFCSDF